MIPFFSTSAPHYHTDICPNDRYNARAHTHLLQHEHSHIHCSITIIHRSSGTLYPLQTTLHNKWTFSHCRPFCLLRAFHFSSQFGVVWWMQMGTYLIGSVPKMEINGALPFFFFFFSLHKLFWAILSSAVCGGNVNEEGRGDAATAGLIQNSLLQAGPRSHTMREGSCMGPMCDGVSMPI